MAFTSRSTALLRIIILIISALAFPSAISARRHHENHRLDSTLRVLDREINARRHYIDLRRASIDSMRSIPMSTLERHKKIGDRYAGFETDSAMFHYRRGLEEATRLGNDSAALVFRLRSAVQMPLLGLIEEARETFISIDTAALPPQLLPDYYNAGRQMSSYIASHYSHVPAYATRWNSETDLMQAALIAHLSPDDPLYSLNLAERSLHHGDYDSSLRIIGSLLPRLSETDNSYARACHIMAEASRGLGNEHEYLYYLSLSAIADLRAATLEVTSLQELGAALHHSEDTERAYSYLTTALANAAECQASMRVLQTSTALTLIEQAHNEQTRIWHRWTRIVMALLAFLLLVAIGAFVMLRVETRRLRHMKERLESANDVKEICISQFLNLCSVYMSQLTQFRKMVERKIATGKVDDLHRLVKSGKWMDEQSREFYDVFDRAFLSIYPDFIDDVNRLLRPDQSIELKQGELLNTDLRILAFLRLGINDATRIAQLLNLSVNTIYAYRSRLRDRALNRDTFEDSLHRR